jgi:hypothetical protein
MTGTEQMPLWQRLVLASVAQPPSLLLEGRESFSPITCQNSTTPPKKGTGQDERGQQPLRLDHAQEVSSPSRSAQ